jgi:probable selenium-dependent hydroxylase accessory protein YqeC
VIYAASGFAWREELRQSIRNRSPVFVGLRALESGKVEGIGPDQANDLFQETILDYLIVEADGAAGRPVKAPAEHEPVIPSSATVVVSVAGLEAMGKPVDEETVFRPDRFEQVTGLSRGDRITPEALARLYSSPDGLFRGSPFTARQVAFLNKCDLLADEGMALQLACLIIEGDERPIDRVIIGSIKKGHYSIMNP